MISVLLPPILGALAGALASVAYSWWRISKEYRALILAFCAEFVSLYEICVMYFDAFMKEEFPYAALFTFTDSSAFSKLASVSKDVDVPVAIIDLKTKYFQVQHYFEEASRYTVEIRKTWGEKERKETMRKARHAQETGLLFFMNEHEETERLTALLVDNAKKLSPGPVTWSLSTRFSEAKNKLNQLKKDLE